MCGCGHFSTMETFCVCLFLSSGHDPSTYRNPSHRMVCNWANER